MKRFILAVLVSVAAATVTFPQSAKADYPYNRNPYDYRGARHQGDRYREGRPYYERDRDRDREYRPYRYQDYPRYNRREYENGYRDREYYPRGYYDRGYYSYPRSNFELIVPLIFR